MTAQNFTAKEANMVLMEIRDRMPVFDLTGRKVGTVTDVQFADDGVDMSGTLSDPQIMGAPDPVRSRLTRTGFVRINMGLLRKDGFIGADQIKNISDEGVLLLITRDKVITL